jgi:hypothetical protein
MTLMATPAYKVFENHLGQGIFHSAEIKEVRKPGP